MKLNRVVYSYAVKITDEMMDLEDGRKTTQTARITFRDKNKNIIERRKYGVIELEEIIEKIKNEEEINISRCYVKNFSATDIRLALDKKLQDYVPLKNFNADYSFFESEHTIDFTFCRFFGDFANFSKSHFGVGNLSFHKSKFEDLNVSFQNTSYSEGNNSFQYVSFGNGNLDFSNTTFINGDISFINTNFGDGTIDFKNVDFGDGNVIFQFAKFGNGNVAFDRTTFNGSLVDFSKVEFGNGKIDFRRTDFGNAEVTFQEMEHGKGKINFRRATFGNNPISFEMAIFGPTEVIFDESLFGLGNISFFNAEANKISLKKCQLSNYVDLRVNKCEVIDMSNTIIRDIIDLKPGAAKVDIDRLYIQGVRIIGKIFISWTENNIDKIIGEQEDTDDHQKADQYRILKEDFHNSGRYNDEDRAYIAFKRHELKYMSQRSIEKNKWNKLWVWPSMMFQKLIFDKMGLYATSPLRVLISIFVVYGLYSVIYMIIPFFSTNTCIECNGLILPYFDFVDSFYYSAITFLTIGYGECLPYGFFKILAPLEGWTGVFMMSYFTVAFVRKILR